MPQLGPSTADADATLSATIAELLALRIQKSDDKAVERRREELRTAFQSLSAAAALPLLIRLREPDPRDPLSMLFIERLSSAAREEMLGYLERTVGPLAAHELVPQVGKLPRAVAERLLQNEVNREVARLRALTDEQLLAQVEAALDSLERLASDPAFADADPAILRAISKEARAAADVLHFDLKPFILLRRRRIRPNIAIGVFVSPGAIAEEATAALAAAAAAATATIAVSKLNKLDPDAPELDVSPPPPPPPPDTLLQNAREIRRELIELLAKARDPYIPPIAQPRTQPTPRRPRRKKPCQREWVPRPTGTRWARVHNEFAAAMVAKFIPNAPPDQDYRITKGGLKSTNYDSYDEDLNIYYEFKTKHQYLSYFSGDYPSPKDPRAWIAFMRAAGIFTQAMDQRGTLLFCGFEGEIDWIFDTKEAADGIRAIIGGWPIDRVIAEPWDRKDRAKTKPKGAGGSF
jgi:hypothetical protein